MKIHQRDPDISTIYNRIKEGHIDLQPDFQRDLVWNLQKKQSLIDTILRDWQFPAVYFVIPKSGEFLEVLDGQQRLSAIYEFMEDGFAVNGNVEPIDDSILRLNGLKYSELPSEVQWRFGRYSLRACELYDYKEQEPYELFFRLNQGSVLTPAEKRNTFYGPVREQIRELVQRMDQHGLNVERIGFNNSRLAYQDVVSRLLFALKHMSIERKITDQQLVEAFRDKGGFSNQVLVMARKAIDTLSESIARKVKLNKPTLFTWLLFFSIEGNGKELLSYIDERRSRIRSTAGQSDLESFLIEIYQEKSSTSVNDAMPVQLRLLVVYLIGLNLGLQFQSPMGLKARRIHETFNGMIELTEDSLVREMIGAGWGRL